MIHLFDNWYIDSDGDTNIILAKKVKDIPKTDDKKKKAKPFKTVGYYGSVEQAMRDLVNRMDYEIISDPEIVELREAIRMLQLSRDRVRKAVQAVLDTGELEKS